MISNKSNSKRFKQFNNSGSKYYAWRNRVILGFGNECFFTGTKTDLELHHIDGNPNNNSPFNLIVVHYNVHAWISKLTPKEFWKGLKESKWLNNESLYDKLGVLQSKVINYAQI